MRTYGHETRASGIPTMKLDFWLTIGRHDNGKPSVKVTAGYPALARNERALNLKMELPTALFETPSLSASIKVEHPQQTITIDTSAVAEAVRQIVGMDVDICVVDPGESV